MANRYELAVAITGDAKGAVNAAKLTQDELAKLAQSANQQMNKIRQSSNIAVDGFNQLKNALGGLGFVALAKQILDVNREFQTLRTSLTTVTGSAQAAEKAFKGIQAFASSTPYTVDQITESFIKLKSLGLEPSARALTAYGNTASAMGKSLNQIIEAVADASVGEFERLKEFGIKARQQSDEVTFTFQGVSTTVKKSADEIQKYLKNIGEVNFSGGMVRQMNTIDGALSNLQDSFSQFYDSLLTGQNEGAIASFINAVANGVKSIDTAFVYVFGTLDTFRAYIEYAFEYAVLQVQAAFKSIVQAAMNGLADFMSTLANGVGAIGLDGLANSFRNFAVSLSAGVPASVELEQGLAKLNEQLQREEAAISENVNSHLSYKQAMQDSNAALLDQIGDKESLIQTNNELSASEQKIADAFQSQVDSLIEQNIQLNLGERALLQYKAAQQGFNDEQQQSILALYDANKALKDHQKAQEDAAKAAEKAAEDQARAYEKAVQQAERQQQRLMNSLSRELSITFDHLLFSGKSFTESLADMFDNMLQRMLNAAIDFASNQIIQGLFSGSWAQTLGGLAVGGLAIGASYLFGGSSAPSRSDIKESRTTTSGDDRAVGFMEMVASDIAARDYYYAKQLEAFQDLQFNLKATANAVVNAVQLSGVDIMGVLKDNVASPIVDTLTSVVPSSIKSAFNSVTSGIGSVFKGLFPSAIANVAGVSTATATQALSFSPAATVNPITGQVSNAQFSPTANALTGDLSSPKIESSAVDNLGTLVSVVGAAYSIYSLISSWGDLNTSQKIVGALSTVSSVLTAGATVVTTAANAGMVAIGAVAGRIIGAIPVVGWVITGLIAAYQSIDALIKGDMRGATDFATTAGFGEMNRQMFGKGIGEIVNQLTVGPISMLASLWEPKTPKISMNTLFSEMIGGAEPPAGSGDLKYKPTASDPDLLYAKKQGRLATITPFGRVTLEPRHFKKGESATVEMFGPILKAIDSIDTQLYESIKSIDLAKGRDAIDRWGRNVGETMASYYDIILNLFQSGQYVFTQKQKAKDVDMATFLASRYSRFSDLLAETGTAIGVTFDNWFDELQTEWGAEHTLSITQALAAALPILIEFPTELELEKLVTDSLKAPEFGGTPDQAMEEILKVVLSYTALSEGLKGLGATDISEQEIVGFLSHMNSIGFAVEEASQSIFEYGIAMAAMGENVSQGVRDLIEYANAQELTNAQLSTFISSAGAYASIGQSLGLTTSLDGLKTFSALVENIARSTLDSNQYNEQIDQAVQYGGMTVEEAKAELESLGIVTADAILKIVNEIVFLQNTLYLFGTELSAFSASVEDTAMFAMGFVESMGGLEQAEEKLKALSQAYFTPAEVLEASLKTAQDQADATLAAIGRSDVTFATWRENFENLGDYTAETAALWVDAGLALANVNQLQEQYNQTLKDNQLPLLQKEIELLRAQGKETDALNMQRKLELDATEDSLKVIQSQIWAEQELAAVRERAAARLSTLADLELQILRAKGEDAQATKVERQGVLSQIETQRQTDIDAFLQAQNTKLQYIFTDADATDISPELSNAIHDYIQQNQISTIQEMYDAAMATGIDVFDVGKAFGQNAQQTANLLTQASIAGFEPTTTDLAGLEQINLDYDQIINSYQELWKLQDAAEDLTDTTTDTTQAVEDLTDAIEAERKRLQDQIDELTLSYVEKLDKERNALFEVNRPLFDRLHLLQVEAQQHDLDIQLLEALGQEQEALAMRRADELAQMDASLHATQKAIWAAQDAAKAEDDLANARNEAISLIDQAFSDLQASVERERKKLQAQYDPLIESARENIDTLTESVNKLKGVVDLLKNTLDSLNPVGQDNFAQRQVAQAQLRNMLAIAQGSGVLPEEEALRDTLSVLSQPSEDLFSNFTDYQRDFYQTSNNIKSLYDIADDQYTKQKSELDIAIEQLDVLEKTYADEMTRLDKIIEDAQAQIDAITGNTDAMLTISEALAALAEALNNFQIQFPTDAVSPTPTIGKELQTFIAQPNSTNAAAANLTLQQSSLITKLTNTSDPAEQQRIKDYASSIGVVLPGFATGGMHSGGWRIVGENGPELEYTGPSQIFSNATSGSLLSQEEMLEELRLLREEVSEMRKENRTGQAALVSSNNKTAKVLNKWDYDGLPATTT